MADFLSDAAKEKFKAALLMSTGDGVSEEKLHVKLITGADLNTSFPTWAVQICKQRGWEIGWGCSKEFTPSGMPLMGYRFNSVDSKGARVTGKILLDEFVIAANSQTQAQLEKYLDTNVIQEAIRQVQKALIESGKPEKVLAVMTKNEEDEMSRKITIARTPKRNIDPKRVKKPPCPLHPETRMEYDAVTEKWRCQIRGCNQVATPKAKAEDKSVTFGKGRIQVRLMYTEDGKAHVILIADNNIALEITDMVDVEALEDGFQIDESVKIANGNGRHEFHVPTEHEIPFKASLFVMGSENYKKD